MDEGQLVHYIGGPPWDAFIPLEHEHTLALVIRDGLRVPLGHVVLQAGHVLTSATPGICCIERAAAAVWAHRAGGADVRSAYVRFTNYRGERITAYVAGEEAGFAVRADGIRKRLSAPAWAEILRATLTQDEVRLVKPIHNPTTPPIQGPGGAHV